MIWIIGYAIGAFVCVTAGAYRGWFDYEAWEKDFLARWRPLRARDYIHEYYGRITMRSLLLFAAWPVALAGMGLRFYVEHVGHVGRLARARRAALEAESQMTEAEIDRIIKAEKL